MGLVQRVYRHTEGELRLQRCSQGKSAGDQIYTNQIDMWVIRIDRNLMASTSLNVAPTRIVEIRDRYVFYLFDKESGALIAGTDGRLRSGDAHVTDPLGWNPRITFSL